MSLWGDFRRLRQRLETDVRGNFPDLPSTEKITQAVRSPISFLDSLADTHAADNEATPAVAGEATDPDPAGDEVLASGGDQPAERGGQGRRGRLPPRGVDQRPPGHRPHRPGRRPGCGAGRPVDELSDVASPEHPDRGTG